MTRPSVVTRIGVPRPAEVDPALAEMYADGDRDQPDPSGNQPGPAPQVDGRVPPHDLDAEAAVLSAVLLEPETLARIPSLRPEHFYSEANRRIFEAIRSLAAQGKPVDIVTVAGVLRGTGRLAQAGGRPYLAQIVDAVPSVAHVEDYAETVEAKAAVRLMMATAARVAAEGYGDIGEPDAWLARARADIGSIGTIALAPAHKTPSDVARAWADAGPLVRVRTGIRSFDDLCGGGLPIPRRVIVIAPPGAGKTALVVHVAYRLATEGDLCAGLLAVDEDCEDVTVRLAQMAGFSLADLERRDARTLEGLGLALAGCRIRLYNAQHTIRTAARDLAAWAQSEGRHAMLGIDSLHVVRSEAGANAETTRELVEANVAELRSVTEEFGLLTFATCEANRSSYRNEDAAETQSDLAAGAESRAIEFSAQTLLLLRTPRDQADVMHVRIAKNRRAQRGEFWLRLDRDRHSLAECGNPAEDPVARAERAHEQEETARGDVARKARKVAEIVRREPGIGTRALRAAVMASGLRLGKDGLDAALRVLQHGLDGERLVDRGKHSRDVHWHLERMTEVAP